MINSSVTSQMKNHKIVIFITTALSVLVDAILLISFIIGGFAIYRYIPVIALLTFDVIYFTSSIFTNYRFSYSTKVLVFHNILTVLATTLQFLLNKGSYNARVMTTFATITFLLVHGISLLAIDISAYVTSRNRVFKVSKFGNIIALLIAIPSLAFSVYFTFTYGFFGQGFGDRVVVYKYNETTDTYTATAIEEGRGKRATIKKLFNDKPVDSIDLSILQDNTIETLTIEDRDNLNLINASNELSINTNLKIAKDIPQRYEKV